MRGLSRQWHSLFPLRFGVKTDLINFMMSFLLSRVKMVVSREMMKRRRTGSLYPMATSPTQRATTVETRELRDRTTM